MYKVIGAKKVHCVVSNRKKSRNGKNIHQKENDSNKKNSIFKIKYYIALKGNELGLYIFIWIN